MTIHYKETVVYQQGVCLCFAILPRCGGGGSGGNKHVINWETQWRQILNTIHLLLDIAYENVESGKYTQTSD